MSRRLDLNRIKDTFRGKADRKQRNVYARSEEQNGQESKPKSQGHEQSLHLNNKKSSPTIRFNPRNLLPVNDGSVEALDNNAASPKGSPHNKDLLPLTPTTRNHHHQARPNDSNNGTSHLRDLADSPERTPPDYSGQDFSLLPPPPNEPRKLLDNVAERLFSDDHLRIILRDPGQFLRFISFVNRYKPQAAPMLTRLLETQKAIKAVEYANAIAETLGSLPGEHSSYTPVAAALLDGRFEARSRRAFEYLVTEALPALITHTLVNVVTDVMVKEITGNTLPVMRDLVAGLNEVFCLTDPSVPDNPIVYASEEFYRTTQYGRDYVIGRNCRFLQGPKTNKKTIARIKAANDAGQESCEVVLNYRRDGTPFLNLLMVAPLYDNRGEVRYFVGAQVDVSGLVEGGRGIESFERLLSDDELQVDQKKALESTPEGSDKTKAPLEHLAELGQMFSYEECNTVQSVSRSNSLRDDASLKGHKAPRPTGTGRPGAPNSRLAGRRVLGDEPKPEDNEKKDWALSTTTLSGKLPGVYQSYLLVRPSPSFKIIFVSPSLRIPGLLQSHFLSRIGGPPHIRDGISDAFSGGVPVTAKVIWLPLGRHAEESTKFGMYDSMSDLGSTSRGAPPKDQSATASIHGKTRWLSCTPLLGSDDQPGVWMVVMVEDERNLFQPQNFGPAVDEKQGRTVLGPQMTNSDGRGSYERDIYGGRTNVSSHKHQPSYNSSPYSTHRDFTQPRQHDHFSRSDRFLPPTPPPTEGLSSFDPPMSKYNTHDDERRPQSARGTRDQDSGYNSAMSPLGMNPARPSTSAATSRTYSLQSTKPPNFETRNTTAMTSSIAGDLDGRKSIERSNGYNGGTESTSQRTSGNSGNSGGNYMGMSQKDSKQGSRGDLRTLRRGEFEGINGSGARISKERRDDLSDLSDGGDHGEIVEEDAQNANVLREQLEGHR